MRSINTTWQPARRSRQRAEGGLGLAARGVKPCEASASEPKAAAIDRKRDRIHRSGHQLPLRDAPGLAPSHAITTLPAIRTTRAARTASPLRRLRARLERRWGKHRAASTARRRNRAWVRAGLGPWRRIPTRNDVGGHPPRRLWRTTPPAAPQTERLPAPHSKRRGRACPRESITRNGRPARFG
jgi:hypothetical protein